MEKLTVLVLGAGASCPHGFPTGGALRDNIIAACENVTNNALASDLLTMAHPEPELKEFGQRFLHSQVTIDEFIQHNPQWENLGRNAIACFLRRLESTRPDRVFRTPDWYLALFHTIKDSPTLLRDRLRIITFNYDRSLEYYLAGALQTAFNLDRDDALKRVDDFGIVHFYGNLGDLAEDERENRPYERFDLSAISTSVRSITLLRSDQAHDEKAEAVEILRAATRVAFLGFGFMPVNVAALQLGTWPKPPIRTYATRQGLTGSVIRRIESLQNLGKFEWSIYEIESFLANTEFLNHV